MFQVINKDSPRLRVQDEMDEAMDFAMAKELDQFDGHGSAVGSGMLMRNSTA